MIIKDLKIFLQNVQKNNLIVNTILETKFKFDVIFIQEPSWTTICSIHSTRNSEGEDLVGVQNHPNWLIFVRNLMNENNFPRVVIYINLRLSSLCFSLWKDILNHRDILLVLFSNNSNILFLMNIYSDSFHLALKYFKDTKVNIWNFLIMTGDFNICDNL